MPKKVDSRSRHDRAHGQVLLDVDDFIEGGDKVHRDIIEKFYNKYKCGKRVNLYRTVEGVLFAGRRLTQQKDYSFRITMDEYVKSSLKFIEVPRGYLSQTTPHYRSYAQMH